MPESNLPDDSEATPDSKRTPLSSTQSEFVESPWVDDADGEPVQAPRPGIGGALLWTIGVLVVHAIGGIITFCALAGPDFFRAAAAGDEAAMDRGVASVTDENGLALIVGEMAFFVPVAIVLTLLAMGRDKGRKLGMKSIRLSHVLLMCSALVPIAMISGALHQFATSILDLLLEGTDLARVLEELDVNNALRDLGKDTSIWVLLPLIALAPAISEELVFRGVIGRGLIARHGMVVGVLITSVLFAMVHMSPAHVVAVFPIGLFMHYLYITTRSFWAPLLFHYLNNSMAVVLMKVTSGVDAKLLEVQDSSEMIAVVVACVQLVLIVASLWRSRVKYSTPCGDDWSPGYLSLETPPNDGSAIETTTPAPAKLLIPTLVLGALVIAGYIVVVQEILGSANV
ncbi:MAG: CPBP family intramembrane metalloprotease [Planctomycetota bacterium]|nr:CPBP family intramembrane metalloprotease [Planctomycetota bacterium]